MIFGRFVLTVSSLKLFYQKLLPQQPSLTLEFLNQGFRFNFDLDFEIIIRDITCHLKMN